MSDIKLFRIEKVRAIELPGYAVGLERSLQRLIEENIETLPGVRFLTSEYSTRVDESCPMTPYVVLHVRSR